MVTAKIPFDFYHDGIHPTHYEMGDELPEDAAKVAIAEGWAVEPEVIVEPEAVKTKKGK